MQTPQIVMLKTADNQKNFQHLDLIIFFYILKRQHTKDVIPLTATSMSCDLLMPNFAYSLLPNVSCLSVADLSNKDIKPFFGQPTI